MILAPNNILINELPAVADGACSLAPSRSDPAERLDAGRVTTSGLWSSHSEAYATRVFCFCGHGSRDELLNQGTGLAQGDLIEPQRIKVRREPGKETGLPAWLTFSDGQYDIVA